MISQTLKQQKRVGGRISEDKFATEEKEQKPIATIDTFFFFFSGNPFSLNVHQNVMCAGELDNPCLFCLIVLFWGVYGAVRMERDIAVYNSLEQIQRWEGYLHI